MPNSARKRKKKVLKRQSTVSPQFLLIKKKQKMETIFQNGIIARFHSLDGNIEGHAYNIIMK
jgi:hypothetical protein